MVSELTNGYWAIDNSGGSGAGAMRRDGPEQFLALGYRGADRRGSCDC
jgi:hypothetical protein